MYREDVKVSYIEKGPCVCVVCVVCVCVCALQLQRLHTYIAKNRDRERIKVIDKSILEGRHGNDRVPLRAPHLSLSILCK